MSTTLFWQPTPSELHTALVLVPGLPALAVLGLSLAVLSGQPLRERTIARTVSALLTASLTLVCMLTWHWWSTSSGALDVRVGSWFSIDDYHFEIAFLLDRLSLTMALVTGVIALLIARFSERYLHREAGFTRYFLLLSLFVAGMQLLVLAGSYDLLFAGWELVGLSSILLIGFYHLRAGPTNAAMRAMLAYRFADVGLLVAGVVLHQSTGSSEFADAFDPGRWPHVATHLQSGTATWIGLLLLLSVMGKSAQFPLGGWLPRAMEGPTPSSALFYGALSVHAGVYLLLRSAPLLERSPVASFLVALVGFVTAVKATAAARTHADAKSMLAYATATQVGLMLVAIGLHWWNWVLLHLVAHAFLRTLQLLRAPSALRDAQELRAALQQEEASVPGFGVWARFFPASTLTTLHHAALRRFLVDEALEHYVVGPLLAASRAADRAEQRWVAVLGRLPQYFSSSSTELPKSAQEQES